MAGIPRRRSLLTGRGSIACVTAPAGGRRRRRQAGSFCRNGPTGMPRRQDTHDTEAVLGAAAHRPPVDVRPAWYYRERSGAGDQVQDWRHPHRGSPSWWTASNRRSAWSCWPRFTGLRPGGRRFRTSTRSPRRPTGGTTGKTVFPTADRARFRCAVGARLVLSTRPPLRNGRRPSHRNLASTSSRMEGTVFSQPAQDGHRGTTSRYLPDVRAAEDVVGDGWESGTSSDLSLHACLHSRASVWEPARGAVGAAARQTPASGFPRGEFPCGRRKHWAPLQDSSVAQARNTRHTCIMSLSVA